MTTSYRMLGRIAGISLATAGAIFVGIQINHPALTLDFVGSTEYLARQALKSLMTVLTLTGITSLWARYARQLGVLGLVGAVVFGIGYLAMFSVEVIAATVLPVLAETAPAYVQDVLTAAYGGVPAGDIGGMQFLNNVAGMGYMFGGLLFGIALFRAGVVIRWASALLAVATTSTLALAVLPDSFNRPFAVPTGIALMGLGWSAWRRSIATAPTSASVRVVEATR